MSFVPMMKYSARTATQQMVAFGGLRYGRGGSDGEFSQTLNLSARRYPALSQRRGRELEETHKAAAALFAKGEKLLVVDGTSVLYDGETVGQVEAGEKMICSVNSKILIFPDKKYYDTEADKFADMAAEVSAAASAVTWGTNTLKITGKGDLSEIFAAGQAVEISGSGVPDNNKSVVIREVSTDTLTVSANAFSARSETQTVKVERKIPDLVCVCESANRLWGAEGKTIWASAQGDPLTFYNYEGLATDSFAVAVGTDGDFTGCIGYSSNVLFFKENALHKVLGTMPSEYRVYDYTVPGVQRGSQKSMEVINEVLYYKGVAGIYAYTGAAPTLLTEAFGERTFNNARGGSDGVNYYVSMQDEDGGWNLFVLDTATGIWLREDDAHIIDFARQNTALHALDAADGNVYLLDRETDQAVSWEALFYPFDETVYGKRGYSRLWIKMELSPGAWVKAEMAQDGGPFRQIGLWSNARRETIFTPLRPGRCDTFQLKLSGRGGCVVKSLVREFIVKSPK